MSAAVEQVACWLCGAGGIPARALASHVHLDCPAALQARALAARSLEGLEPEPCALCEAPVPRRALAAHMQRECPERLVTCPNGESTMKEGERESCSPRAQHAHDEAEGGRERENVCKRMQEKDSFLGRASIDYPICPLWYSCCSSLILSHCSFSYTVLEPLTKIIQTK